MVALQASARSTPGHDATEAISPEVCVVSKALPLLHPGEDRVPEQPRERPGALEHRTEQSRYRPRGVEHNGRARDGVAIFLETPKTYLPGPLDPRTRRRQVCHPRNGRRLEGMNLAAAERTSYGGRTPARPGERDPPPRCAAGAIEALFGVSREALEPDLGEEPAVDHLAQDHTRLEIDSL